MQLLTLHLLTFRSGIRKKRVCSKSITKILYQNKSLVSECILKLVCYCEACRLLQTRCACVCVRVCVCVCLFTSIHSEGFICLDQLGYQRTNHQCYVEDVIFYAKSLHRFFRMQNLTFLTSHFILFTHYVSLSEHGTFIHH